MQFLKFLFIALIVVFAGWGLYSFITLFDSGGWFQHASYITIALAFIGIAAGLWVAYWLIKLVLKMPKSFNDIEI